VRPQPLSHDEVATFSTAMGEAFGRATERAPLHPMLLEIGGVRVALDFAGAGLAEAFQLALSGMRDRPAHVPGTDARDADAQDADGWDVRLAVFDCTATGIDVPDIGRPVRALMSRRGECATAPGSSVTVLVDFDVPRPSVSVTDATAGSGVVAIGDLQRLPSWALAAPLRAQLALLLQPHGIQLAHGAAVGRPDGVIFLTGYGGSGKSTTALSAHRRGLTLLGDDYVALKLPVTPGALPTVHLIYASLKVHPDGHQRDPGGAVQHHDKLVLFPFADDGAPPCDEAPCVGFWDARLGSGVTSWLEPRHAEDVARIAIASTGLQLPGDDTEMARLITRCAEAAPTRQRLHLGSDREGVIDVIGRVLDGDVPGQPSAPAPSWAAPGALRPISVVIPVHDGARFIGEALACVHAQEYPELEVIVVDDGSTDDLDAALAEVAHPFRLVRQANQGAAAARNAGIAAAQHDWVAFLDVDDLWPPGVLRLLAQHLILHPDVPVVHGDIATLYPSEDGGPSDGGGWVVGPSEDDVFPFIICAGLYRRDIFDRVGGFDASLRYGEDTEWFVRLRLRHPSVMIPDVIVHRRRHPDNMTNDREAMARGTREALAKAVAHRMRARRQ